MFFVEEEKIEINPSSEQKKNYNKDFPRVKAIYDALTDEEKKAVSPKNNFVDSDKVLYREVMANKKKEDVGFIDVYPFNKKEHIGYIIMAVHPDFRKKGYSKKLISSAILNCKKLRMSKLIYRCNPSNPDSLNSIKRDKRFSTIAQGEKYVSYGIDLDRYEEDVPENAEQTTTQESFLFRENNKAGEIEVMLNFFDTHDIDLYESSINIEETQKAFNEAKAHKTDKDGWYTDKYGNRKIKADSYYVGMDAHADEEEWKKKIVFKSFDKKIDQYSHGKPQPAIIIDGKIYRARSEVIVIDGNKILIDKTKNRGGFGYTFPGGGIGPGEFFSQNARRECEEEALIIPKKIQYMNIAWILHYTHPIMNDGAISFVCVAEKGKDNFKGKIKTQDRDEFADHAVWVDYRRMANLAPPHKLAIERFINGQEFELADLAETTGPAASGPVIGMEKDLAFVSQYSSKKSSKKNIVEGYAISNDMFTKNILVTDCETGKLKLVPISYLDERQISMFEFRKPGTGEKIQELCKEIGKPHTKEYIYECLTGKELLSDDQLFCDQDFTFLDIAEMGAEVISEIQTIISDYIHPKEFELMNISHIREADKLTEGKEDIQVLENQNGFFAKNVKTGKRTGYFKNIKEIKLNAITKKKI